MSEATCRNLLGLAELQIKELQVENNLLRNGYSSMSREHTQTIVELSDAYEKNDQLQAENAKLRELVKELWEGYQDPPCDGCQLKGKPACADCPICAREALVIDHLRELGIEVDG